MKNCTSKLPAFVKKLLKKKMPLTLADLYPVNLLAHTIAKNIPRCSNEAQLKATARLVQTHLAARYPKATAQKYITHLKWELFFRRVALEMNEEVTSS